MHGLSVLCWRRHQKGADTGVAIVEDEMLELKGLVKDWIGGE
jgi:hypothetical protein